MAGIDAGFWVCGDCRSVNSRGAKQCYQCRTPRDIGAVDPAEIEGTGHGRLREIVLPEFQSTRWAAVAASVLLVLVAVMQVVATVSDAILFGRVLRNPALLTDPAFSRSVESMVAGTAAIAALGVALLALIAWSFWLSRAVMAMPALGLGYPAANGLLAFVENFLPGLNLFRVPAIVRDVMRRLEPESLRGEALIFAAWIGLLGGYLAPRFGVYLGLLGTGTLEEIVSETLLVQSIATALVVVGATFLVALIWWIERRIERRRAAQLAGEPPPGATEVGPVPGIAEPPHGSIASRADSAGFASRSITAATGAAAAPSLPAPSGARAAPVLASAAEVPTAAAEAPAAPEPVSTSEAAAPAPEPPDEAAAGPQLHLRVEGVSTMIATVDGESEPITLDELRAAAAALARASGSAVIETVGSSFGARSLAEQAFEVLLDAGVVTTVEE